MSETGDKKKRKELRAENAKLRASIAEMKKRDSPVTFLLLLAISFVLGMLLWSIFSRAPDTNNPVVIHAPLFSAMDHPDSRLLFEPARVLTPHPGSVECHHAKFVTLNRNGRVDGGGADSSWECHGEGWVRRNIKAYNYTETPDDHFYISCIMDAEARVFPQSCLFHAREPEKPAPKGEGSGFESYFYNALHLAIIVWPILIIMLILMIIEIAFYLVTLPFFFMCVWTWYAPMWVLAFYLGWKTYTWYSSKFPWVSKTMRIIQVCFTSDNSNSFQTFMCVCLGIVMGLMCVLWAMFAIFSSQRMYFICPVLVCLVYFGGGNEFVLKFVSDCKATFREVVSPPTDKTQAPSTEEK